MQSFLHSQCSNLRNNWPVAPVLHTFMMNSPILLWGTTNLINPPLETLKRLPVYQVVNVHAKWGCIAWELPSQLCLKSMNTVLFHEHLHWNTQEDCQPVQVLLKDLAHAEQDIGTELILVICVFPPCCSEILQGRRGYKFHMAMSEGDIRPPPASTYLESIAIWLPKPSSSINIQIARKWWFPNSEATSHASQNYLLQL